MKWLGALMLAVSGLWLGLAARASLARDAAVCAELCRLTERLKYEIERFRVPLPDFFRRQAMLLQGTVAKLCSTVSDGLERGECFLLVWERETGMLLPQEREIVAPLGGILGSFGAEESAAAVEDARQRLEELHRERRSMLREQGRLRVWMCSAGGLMLAVLLL